MRTGAAVLLAVSLKHASAAHVLSKAKKHVLTCSSSAQAELTSGSHLSKQSTTSLCACVALAGVAELVPGVLFIDEVHMLDIECFTYLNRYATLAAAATQHH